jgi:hypothetical protein
MAYRGQTLKNPASGERITFRQTAAETNGDLRELETAVALAEQGRTMRKGIPKPLDLALFTREFEQEVQAAFPPLWLQRLALAPLAWLAKRRGHATRYAPEPTATHERHAIETLRSRMVTDTIAVTTASPAATR